MPIQLPDYQAEVSRVTKGFDNLLQFYRDKKRREAESRQFARRRLLQEDQQNFQAEQAQQSRDLRLKLSKSSQELRKQLQEDQQSFAVKEANRQFQRREELTDKQIKAQNAAREDSQAFDEEMLDKKLGVQKAVAGAQNVAKYSGIVEDRKEDVRDRLDKKYMEMMNATGIKYSGLATTKSGQVVLRNVEGSVFGGEDVTFDQFRNRMGNNVRAWNKYKEAKQGAEDGRYRRIENADSPSYVNIMTDQGDQKNLYAYGPYKDKLLNDIKTGGGEDGSYSFTKSAGDSNILDSRKSYVGTEINGQKIYESFLSQPVVTIETPEKKNPIVFDFFNDTKAQLDVKFEKIQNKLSSSKDNQRDMLGQSDVGLQFGYDRAKKLMDRYNSLRDYLRSVTPDKYKSSSAGAFRLSKSKTGHASEWYGYGGGSAISEENQQRMRENVPFGYTPQEQQSQSNHLTPQQQFIYNLTPQSK